MFYLCSAAVLERGVNQQQAAEEDTTSVLLVRTIKNIIYHLEFVSFIRNILLIWKLVN